eukprot:8972336-Pyramimonas_sp.AAC.1
MWSARGYSRRRYQGELVAVDRFGAVCAGTRRSVAPVERSIRHARRVHPTCLLLISSWLKASPIGEVNDVGAGCYCRR